MLFFILSFFVISDEVYYCDVSKSSIKLESNNLLCNSTSIPYSQSNKLQVYVVGNTETNGVIVQNSNADFYLLNTNIKAESAFSVIGGKVNIILSKGSSSVTSTNDAGISCSGNAEITFSGDSSAKLISTSSLYSAIGTGKSSSTCKLISINGKMEIEANGGYYGSGIGAGWGFVEGTSNIDKILIQDGRITATSPSNAGIGGGTGRTKYSSNVNEINILGGSIQANGGEWGAGIGGGYGFSDHSSNVNNIIIAGGEVISAGGRHAAGIGAGGGLSSTNASSVTHLSLLANQIVSSSDSNSNTVCVNVRATGGSRSEPIGNGSGGVVTEKDEKGATSQCTNAQCTFESTDTSTCVAPWKCSVQHCFKCSEASSCSACEKGYKLDGNFCKLDSSLPTTTATTTTSSSSSSSTSSAIQPTTEPTIPVVNELLTILYCPSDADNTCQNAKSDWDKERYSIIANLNRRAKFVSVLGARPFYHTVGILERSTKLTSIATNINELQNALRHAMNVAVTSSQKGIFNLIILQSGRMTSSDAVDLSVLQPYSSSQVFFNVTHAVVTEKGEVNYKVGDVSTFVHSLNLIFAEKTAIVSGYESKAKSFISVSTLTLTHSRFANSQLGNKYNVSADQIVCDEYSANSLSNLVDGCVDKVIVNFPIPLDRLDIEMKTKSVFVSIPYTGASLLEADDTNADISTTAASNQTVVKCTANQVSFSLDPKTESADYNLNVSLENDAQSAKVEFAGSNWDACQFLKPIIVSTNENVELELQSKPENVEVKVEKRSQGGSESQKEKKKKLSKGAIAGISIGVIVLIALIVFLIVYFLVIKKKKDRNTAADEKLLSE